MAGRLGTSGSKGKLGNMGVFYENVGDDVGDDVDKKDSRRNRHTLRRSHRKKDLPFYSLLSWIQSILCKNSQ